MLEITNTAEMGTAFDRFIRRLDAAKERLSELEDVSIEGPKNKMQRDKNREEKSRHNTPQLVAPFQTM